MTTLETRLKGINLIDKTMILQYNVNEGCEEDVNELEENLVRLNGLKNWAKENDQLKEIQHYFSCGNFGSLRFVSYEISKIFYS